MNDKQRFAPAPTGVIALSALTAVLASCAHAAPPPAPRGWFDPGGGAAYSHAAVYACEAATPDPAGFAFESPDRKRRIGARPVPDGEVTLYTVTDDDGRERIIDTAAWNCPEIGWSPASDRFFITYSDGGLVGNYQVSAYRIVAGRWEQLDVSGNVQREFLRGYPKCSDPETPNLFGVAWSGDGQRLLVAAQVLNHSNCDDMGTFRLYEVAVPGGAILRRYSQLEAKAVFYGLLGPDLRAADDACLTHPGSCHVPMLHGRGSK